MYEEERESWRERERVTRGERKREKIGFPANEREREGISYWLRGFNFNLIQNSNFEMDKCPLILPP